MTSLQHLVLEGLWYEEGVTAAELGKLLVLDKATLSGVLERMVDSEWIKRSRDHTDGRVYRLYPSDKANQIKRTLIDLRVRANDELLSSFTNEEKAFLKRVLRDMI